jgi:hypothetical protein
MLWIWNSLFDGNRVLTEPLFVLHIRPSIGTTSRAAEALAHSS